MSKNKEDQRMNDFYRTEAKTILLMPEEERQKILTNILKTVDMRREYITNEINKIQHFAENLNNPEHELYNPDFYPMLSNIANDLYTILWNKTYT